MLAGIISNFIIGLEHHAPHLLAQGLEGEAREHSESRRKAGHGTAVRLSLLLPQVAEEGSNLLAHLQLPPHPIGLFAHPHHAIKEEHQVYADLGEGPHKVT